MLAPARHACNLNPVADELQKNSMSESLGFGSQLIDTGLYRPGHAACYLIEDAGEFALIDTGTQHSLPRILDTLAEHGGNPEDLRYVIPTHVHLDHAGGSGQVMAACPNATLVVHPKGLPHVVDPSKLQASATAVYGEAAFTRDFGTLQAVDAKRTLAADDGQAVQLGQRQLRLVYTPGHANHHWCIHDSSSGYLYTGDTFGLGYREFYRQGTPLLVATTTPVAFDPDAWMLSLERMMDLSPTACCLTHFGAIERPERYVDTLRRSIEAHRAIALAEEPRDPVGREARLMAAVEAELVDAAVDHSGLPRDEIRALFDSDIQLNAQGLDIWLKRRAKRAG
jgi:glyoxylase-like metal-dependent hydrolase (beta-lactamase superfamily II)